MPNPYIAPAEWQSFSGDSGQCVQWRNPPGAVPGSQINVGDSKDPEGPSLTFPMTAWLGFAGGVATGTLVPVS